MPLGPGVIGFQIAQGNFVFLFFSLGSKAVKEEIIRWLEEAWPPLGWCWVTPARSCLFARGRAWGYRAREA